MVDIDQVARKALATCNHQGWSRNWKEVGCYLHLEASEFVEALRGKGFSSIRAEAADVLFVLLSALAAHDIDPSVVLELLDKRLLTPEP